MLHKSGTRVIIYCHNIEYLSKRAGVKNEERRYHAHADILEDLFCTMVQEYL